MYVLVLYLYSSPVYIVSDTAETTCIRSGTTLRLKITEVDVNQSGNFFKMADSNMAAIGQPWISDDF